MTDPGKFLGAEQRALQRHNSTMQRCEQNPGESRNPSGEEDASGHGLIGSKRRAEATATAEEKQGSGGGEANRQRKESTLAWGALPGLWWRGM